ncbi:MAG TPA: BamA/TamA family outer membrane protein [Candidatus Krumholzibacteria bacterium]|nr:BamA/TamA family outer membrane protein [Candidatus Krumholzibacteria bacterium]
MPVPAIHCTLAVALLCLLLCPEVSPAETSADADPGRSLTIVPFPFLFYQDETELGGGASLSFITRRQVEGARSENSGLLFLYTARDQYSIAAEFERYFDRERWHLEAMVGFQEFPADFFGFGNDTPADGSEVYTPRGFEAAALLEYEFGGRWRTGPRLYARTQEMVRRDDDGRLESLRPTGWDGTDLVQIGWSLIHDGRDHVFYPRSGWWLQAATDLSASALGSGTDHTAHQLDLRAFRTIGKGWPGDPVLATRLTFRHTAGDVPFDRLPSLGGANLLRGYFGGRFRDRTLYTLQAEVRTGHWKRLGTAVFTGVGRVANGLDALSLDDLHAVYGIGARLQLSSEENLHVRADLGFSDQGGTGFYLAFLEAF